MDAFGGFGCSGFTSEPAEISKYFSHPHFTWIFLLYLVSGVSYVFTFKALEFIPTSTAGAINILGPVVGTLTAFILLGKTLLIRQPIAVS